MLIKASQTGWQEITSDQNYYGEEPCAPSTPYSHCTKLGSTVKHWPTLSNVGLRSTVIKKPRKLSLNELVKIIERYECAIHLSQNHAILTGEPEDLVRALSRLATLTQ